MIFLHQISSLLPKYPRGGYTIATAESKDTREIRRLVEEIVFSPEDKAKVLLLRGDAAKGFLLELSDVKPCSRFHFVAMINHLLGRP